MSMSPTFMFVYLTVADRNCTRTNMRVIISRILHETEVRSSVMVHFLYELAALDFNTVSPVTRAVGNFR